MLEGAQSMLWGWGEHAEGEAPQCCSMLHALGVNDVCIETIVCNDISQAAQAVFKIIVGAQQHIPCPHHQHKLLDLVKLPLKKRSLGARGLGRGTTWLESKALATS